MPCSDGREFSPSTRIEYREDTTKLNKLIVLLCSACRALERLDYDFEENPSLSVWYDNHKKEDAKRELEEKKKKFRKKIALEATLKPFKDLSKEEKECMKEFGIL